MRRRKPLEPTAKSHGTPEQSCIGKKSYTNWAHAERSARAINRRRLNSDRARKEPYPCQYCGGIHVGASWERPPREKPLREWGGVVEEWEW